MGLRTAALPHRGGGVSAAEELEEKEDLILACSHKEHPLPRRSHVGIGRGLDAGCPGTFCQHQIDVVSYRFAVVPLEDLFSSFQGPTAGWRP